MSYVPNEIIMPRKKFNADHDNSGATSTTRDLCLVRSDEIKDPANTILVAEFSQYPDCIFGTSGFGAQAYKSHRPTNAIKTSPYTHPKQTAPATTTVFDGDVWTQLDVDPVASGAQKPTIHKLTVPDAEAAIAGALTAPDKDGYTWHHISYINPSAHVKGANYLVVDGHVEKLTFDQTLNPRNFMWGRRVYSLANKPLIQD